jgi:hypothetical protein
MKVFQDDGESLGWTEAGPGDVVTIPGGVRHAIRNPGSTAAACVLITEDTLYRFLRELAARIGRGAEVPVPSEDVMRKLFEVAAQYGYWIGSPVENAAIGIKLG